MANAGCINAYDCNGCLIQTLQNLDSACIGVGVQYTAPNPLDDKRFDYIKYTDKCGCVQCLSGENEILIYATNGVIKNLTLTNDDVNEAIKIKWNDIFGSNRVKTVVRYKTGSYPTSITDGTLAVEETTKNQYSSTPFSLSGVLDETTYYISAFAVDSNGTIIDVQGMSIETDFMKRYIPNSNTKVYVPMDTDLLDHGPNSRSITNNNSVSLASLGNVKFKVGKFSGAVRYLTFTNIDNMSGAWTISAWANTSTGINQMFFSQGTNQNNRLLHVGYSSSGRGLVFAMYNNDADTESTQRIDGNRHLYTFTWNGSTGYNIYVDGVSVKSGTLSSGFQSGNNIGHIGIQANLTTPVEFQGYISEFFIETGTWNASKVLQFFNETKKNYGR